MNKVQIEAFVLNWFTKCNEWAEFKNTLRDFLIQMKQMSSTDDYYIQEKKVSFGLMIRCVGSPATGEGEGRKRENGTFGLESSVAICSAWLPARCRVAATTNNSPIQQKQKQQQ